MGLFRKNYGFERPVLKDKDMRTGTSSSRAIDHDSRENKKRDVKSAVKSSKTPKTGTSASFAGSASSVNKPAPKPVNKLAIVMAVIAIIFILIGILAPEFVKYYEKNGRTNVGKNNVVMNTEETEDLSEEKRSDESCVR